MSRRQQLRVGVVGTGFISRHFVLELAQRPGFALGKVLTRRPLDRCPEYPRPEALTDSRDALIEASDVVFECSGDTRHAADTITAVLAAGKPVVTLNAEFHVTIGSAFVERGLLSEAEGDQPGCLAALHEEVVAMGFQPLAYANMKGFLNLNPSPEEMRYWARRNNFSLNMVTSFTDGTKLQIEQCLVANGLNTDIEQEGLLGLVNNDIESAAKKFGPVADRRGRPISDYILDSRLPHGVFIVARHDEQHAAALQNYKIMGEFPYYVLLRNFCLVYLEVFKTIERVWRERRILLNNGPCPRVGVASVAKRDLVAGERIKRGCGSFELRGTCVNLKNRPGHLPICLADDVHVRRRVEAGAILTLDDVDLPASTALTAWQQIERRALQAT